jgi:acyl-[acyl-carrier-protein]-phospholipid O-acyltransferase/long-chain-fatty-acid--[acyl-carrier-protein] ligase
MAKCLEYERLPIPYQAGEIRNSHALLVGGLPPTAPRSFNPGSRCKSIPPEHKTCVKGGLLVALSLVRSPDRTYWQGMNSLMLSRRFAPLFWCQFFSAFSDNFLKTALVFIILFQIGGPNAEALITAAGGIFIAPFFFFSSLGGQIADRFDKAQVARRLKFAEIGVAFVAVAGFTLQSVPVLFVALFLFGLIGALFGPMKYGILPDHLARAELPAANALVEGATFMAILLGTIMGGLAARGGGDPHHLSLLMIVFALMCWGSSLFIPSTGQAAPSLKISWNIAASTTDLIKHLWTDSRLWWGSLVSSWFWLSGIIVMSLLPPLVGNGLGGNEEVVTAFLAAFSIAVAIGSGFAAFLARGRILLWPTPVGAVILGLCAFDIGWANYGVEPAATMASIGTVLSSLRGVRSLIDLSGIAIGGGLFIVPAFAAVQAWAGVDRRARVIAAVNVLNAAFMVVGSLAVSLLQGQGVGIPTLFMVLGASNLVVAALVARTTPATDNR